MVYTKIPNVNGMDKTLPTNANLKKIGVEPNKWDTQQTLYCFQKHLQLPAKYILQWSTWVTLWFLTTSA